MAKTVVGLYDTETAAREAVRELEENGFGDLPIHIEAEGADDARFARGGNLRDALRGAGVPEDDATFYVEGVQDGGSLLILEAPDDRAEDAARLMNLHEPIRRDRQPEQRATHRRERGVPEGEEAHMTEAREEMRVGKREVAGGGVRIHKRVRERPVEETVNLREEEVDVERHATSETTADPEDAFEEETIEMTETREEPVVEKETHTEGEVVAQKQARERSETIRDTVRETEIDVEQIGEGFREHADDFRTHYESTYADTDYGYGEYEPAYRFGYAYGTHEDFAGRNYADVEPDLRRDYNRKHGEGMFERVTDAVRHAYNRVRR